MRGPTLQMQSKLSDAFLSKSPPPGAFGGVVEPGGGVLVDQQGGVVHFDIRVNRTLWEFVVNQNDYWKTGVSLAGLTQNLRRDYHVPPGETTGGFPAARAGMPDGPVGDVGSLEVKSAWKILTPAEIASGAYYTRTFALDDPDGP
ncbi:MAG: hypothetical protein AB1689_17810, partial [Thermodesulfobacteriota bacterium]